MKYFKYTNKSDFFKCSMMLLMAFFVMSSPAHAASTLSDVILNVKQTIYDFKELIVAFGIVMALGLVVMSATILYRKVDNDHTAKISHCLYYFAGAVLAGGATWWVATLGETVGATMATY